MKATGEKVNTERHQMDSNHQSATITVDEARSIIGTDQISRGALYGAIKRGEVPNLRLGGRILIPRQAFMKWLGGGSGAAT